MILGSEAGGLFERVEWEVEKNLNWVRRRVPRVSGRTGVVGEIIVYGLERWVQGGRVEVG